MGLSYTDSLAALGPLGVFLLMVPESACIPLPSELTLVSAGVAVGNGWMSPWAAVAAATAGNLAGSLIAYAAGRSGVLDALPAAARPVLARCDQLFASHGNRAVFLARLLPLARSFVSLPAGHARIPVGEFTAFTTAGCAIWATGFVLAGWLLGSGAAQVGMRAGDFAVAGVAVVLLAKWIAARRRGDQDEAASEAAATPRDRP